MSVIKFLVSCLIFVMLSQDLEGKIIKRIRYKRNHPSGNPTAIQTPNQIKTVPSSPSSDSGHTNSHIDQTKPKKSSVPNSVKLRFSDSSNGQHKIPKRYKNKIIAIPNLYNDSTYILTIPPIRHNSNSSASPSEKDAVSFINPIRETNVIPLDECYNDTKTVLTHINNDGHKISPVAHHTPKVLVIKREPINQMHNMTLDKEIDIDKTHINAASPSPNHENTKNIENILPQTENLVNDKNATIIINKTIPVSNNSTENHEEIKSTTSTSLPIGLRTSVVDQNAIKTQLDKANFVECIDKSKSVSTNEHDLKNTQVPILHTIKETNETNTKTNDHSSDKCHHTDVEHNDEKDNDKIDHNSDIDKIDHNKNIIEETNTNISEHHITDNHINEQHINPKENNLLRNKNNLINQNTHSKNDIIKVPPIEPRTGKTHEFTNIVEKLKPAKTRITLPKIQESCRNDNNPEMVVNHNKDIKKYNCKPTDSMDTKPLSITPSISPKFYENVDNSNGQKDFKLKDGNILIKTQEVEEMVEKYKDCGDEIMPDVTSHPGWYAANAETYGPYYEPVYNYMDAYNQYSYNDCYSWMNNQNDYRQTIPIQMYNPDNFNKDRIWRTWQNTQILIKDPRENKPMVLELERFFQDPSDEHVKTEKPVFHHKTPLIKFNGCYKNQNNGGYPY